MRGRTLSVPREQWHDVDQQRFTIATTPQRKLFGPHRYAMRLRKASVAMAEASYSYFQGYLRRSGQFDPDEPIAARVTPERRDGWVEDCLDRGNAHSAIRIGLFDLRRMMLMIAPELDTRFILRPFGETMEEALPVADRERPHHDSLELRDRALALYAAGAASDSDAERETKIRDAAVLGLLALRAPRRATIAAMCLETHIRKVKGQWIVTIPPEDDKTKEPSRWPVPDILTPVFDAYILHVRPGMEGALRTDRLWMGTKGRPLDARDLGKMVRRRTKAWFGYEIGPHAFRRFYTTTIAMMAPEHVVDAGLLLNHSPRTQAKNYNKAGTDMAAARYESLIDRLTEATADIAAREFGWVARKPGGKAKRRSTAP